MVRKLLILALIGIAVISFSNVGTVSAGPNTKLDLVQDCSTGCPEAIDMAGPTGFGFVNYNQDNSGVLRLLVSLKNAEPNATYNIYLTCGPTHDTACSFVDVGSVTTNGQGNGTSANIIVPLSTLQSSPLGSGARTDHLDILSEAGPAAAGSYVAANLNYTVP
jgi:hypothetical protein